MWEMIAATGGGKSNDTPLFWIGLAVWALPCLITGVTLTRAQQEYLRHYRTARHIRLPLSGEPGMPAQWGGYRALAKYAPIKWKAYHEPQPEPELEVKRQGILRLQRIFVTWMLVGALVAFGLGILGEITR